MEGLNFLIVAYSITWVLIFLYVLFLQKKQEKLENEIELLEDIAEAGQKRDI